MLSMTRVVYSVLPYLGIALAATCISPDGNDAISIDDAQQALTILANNELDPPIDYPLYLEASHSREFDVNTVNMCIGNDYLFENTHVAQSDMINAIQDIIDQCYTGGDFYGGTYQILGDSGLPTQLYIRSSYYQGC
ncbi:hypothetical protein BX600DRAFT_463151 [Xylariales sp. PMI_506]|nr:hypothetical protein BX600DRAFT_463151 [Xylariales sp. PMI_506]